MLKVKYVGSHIEISQHGIHYKKDKEDKYVYLMVAFEILKDIDNATVVEEMNRDNEMCIKLQIV